MAKPIRLGISTCPNDTFAFHGLMNREVDMRGLEFEIELLDIQQLNNRIHQGDFDVAKASFNAALSLSDRTMVLPSGSALGFGVGPLLLASASKTTPTSQTQLTLCPGEDTTAHLLFQLFHPRTTRVEQVVFSDVMPKLQAAAADFGVCIHEGRFTWQQAGLHLVEDLGERWETSTQCPLPLGGILAFNSLGSDLISKIQAVLSDSISLAKKSPETALPTMRKYAQEFDDSVLMQHVDLYVNDWTMDLGEVGETALNELSNRAKATGLLAETASPLKIFDQN